MKKLFPFLLFILAPVLISLACAGSSIMTPTPPSAMDVGLTMIGDKLNAEATKQKFDTIVEITAQVAAATATQQAVFVAQATSDQARRDAQATQQRMDADATQQAVNIQATQMRLDLEATQSQARLDVQSAQEAQGTAMAWSMTQAVIPLHDSWTQQAVQKDILIATNEVEISNLNVKKARDTNVLSWLVPWGVAIFLAFVAAMGYLKWSKVREVKDENGNVRVLVFDNQRAILPALLSGPVINLETGEVPSVVDPKEQSEIVKRDQAIRALEAMPIHPTSDGVQAFNGMFSGTEKKSLPVIEVIQPDQIGTGVLEQLEGQVSEEEG